MKLGWVVFGWLSAAAAGCSKSPIAPPPASLSIACPTPVGADSSDGNPVAVSTVLTVDLPASYPTVPTNLLRTRYPTQALTVINAGNAGELASGEGVRRFGSALTANQPEVVLLMEGTNDLLFQLRGIDPALQALETMMAEAEARNVRVCLATIPPQRGGGVPDRSIVAGIIPGFNDQVRALAARRDAVLVDVYAGMKDDPSLIGRDNLHPTVRGYEVMASIFDDAIVRAFDSRSAAYRALFDTGTPASRTMCAIGATR